MTLRRWGTPPPQNLALSDTDVHVWRVFLDMHCIYPSRWNAYLSYNELVRVDTYPDMRRRRRYITGQAVLKRILARYLHVPAEEVRFATDEFGKPRLEAPHDTCGLFFNTTHAYPWTLHVVTRLAMIGVDVEEVRALPDMDIVIEDCFSVHEISILEKLGSGDREREFYRVWVRKEAIAKALGIGLQVSFKDIKVVLSRRRTYCTIDICRRLRKWAVFELVPAPDYCAALALESEECGERDIQLWSWHW